MIKYEMKEALGREIRQDDPADLAISNWTLVRDAIKEGRTDEALELMDYEISVGRRMIDGLTLMRQLVLARLASYDESEVEKLYRERYAPWVKDMLSATPGVEEGMQRFCELFRNLQSNIVITEEPDRWVLTMDPCGSGGRLIRSGPFEGTKKPYTWSWGRSGVCYYCSHCCMFQEILPIEERGYPICVTQYPENPQDPCVHYYYKKPELIPDEYFTRIGKTPYRLTKS